MLTEEEFLALDGSAMREVDAAVAFAEAGHWEPVDELSRDVLTPRTAGHAARDAS
jgi:pyruvate dehydrogenase E1 component alpha subunit